MNPKVHLHFCTFGVERPARPDVFLPVLLEIDCRITSPAKELRSHYTGLDAIIVNDIFSRPENEAMYQDHLAEIKHRVRSLKRADPRAFLIPVYCGAGVHRSVAISERLMHDLKHWPYVTSQVTYLNLRDAIEKRVRKNPGYPFAWMLTHGMRWH